VYNFHLPLALKVVRSSSAAGCDIALVFIFQCVGLIAIFCGVMSYSGFLSIGVYFVVSQLWCCAGGVFARSGVTVCRVL
jgi:hypothetical protein